MDAVSGFYETTDTNSLISDFLSFPKFDRSIILVKDGRGLNGITTPLSTLVYIKPGKASSLKDAVIIITTFFNEYTPITVGNKSITLKKFMEDMENYRENYRKTTYPNDYSQ